MKESIRKIMYICAGAVYLLFFVAGIVLGKEVEIGRYSFEETFSFAQCLIYWVAGFVSGSIFLGIGGIMENQESNYSKMRNIETGLNKVAAMMKDEMDRKKKSTEIENS